MNYNRPTQTRTYKIIDENKLTEDDFNWLKSLKNVTTIETHKKSLTVLTKIVDSIAEIVKSINCKFCNSSKPKLKPLF
jgi:hypothetical protein